MRLHRFYVSQPLGEEVVIEDGLTIKQWLKVFRYDVGDFVILFNGDGYDYTYSLTKTSSSSCTLLLSEKNEVSLPTHKSFLFLSVIKKDLFELVVEKATESGITDIVPLITEHTEKKNLNVERLESIIKEATEQCGRNDLPVLHDPVTFTDSFLFLEKNTVSPLDTYITTLFGQPLQSILIKKLSIEAKNLSLPAAFFVGPEGGWSEKEEQLIKEKRVTAVSLGTTVLRAETAGIVCSFLSTVL
jgi:16S rRNA (uracil1498-N3)-methyltransferase